MFPCVSRKLSGDRVPAEYACRATGLKDTDSSRVGPAQVERRFHQLLQDHLRRPDHRFGHCRKSLVLNFVIRRPRRPTRQLRRYKNFFKGFRHELSRPQSPVARQVLIRSCPEIIYQFVFGFTVAPKSLEQSELYVNYVRARWVWARPTA